MGVGSIMRCIGMMQANGRRWLQFAVLAVAVPVGSAGSPLQAMEAREAPVLQALAASIDWLEAHPPDPARDKLGNLALDAWAWYLFASRHPDAATRTHAGEQVDRRLRKLPLPGPQTEVSLSYWALLLRLMQLRGLDTTAYRNALAKVDLTPALQDADSTTAWWTGELLRRAGFKVNPDFSRTFIGSLSAADPADSAANVRDAYRAFHEIIPATDLGRLPNRLSAEQRVFLRGALPALIRAGQITGDTDAVAEAIVTSAVMGEKATPAYTQGITWLLARQRGDGTYRTSRGTEAQPKPADAYRHIVVVGSYALLTSLGA
jgi:uncharacterized protein DUF6895